jgi:disulfide bond formation protein DsbB
MARGASMVHDARSSLGRAITCPETSVSVAAVQLFYALLAIAAQVAIVGVAILWLTSRVAPTARLWYEDLAGLVHPNALAACFVVALLATAGSLYFSEVAGFQPCTLCWYQRIAMYPLVVVFGIAAAYRDRGVDRYAVAIAGIGAAISAYHVLLEVFPGLDTGACSATVPCTLVWFREFGYISLPVLALTAFLLILTLLSFRPSAVPTTDEAEVDTTDAHGSPA